MDHLSRPWFSVSDSHTPRVEPLSQNLEGATFSLGPLWYTLLSFQSFSQKFEVLTTLFAHKLYFAQNGAPRGKREKKATARGVTEKQGGKQWTFPTLRWSPPPGSEHSDGTPGNGRKNRQLSIEEAFISTAHYLLLASLPQLHHTHIQVL